MQASVSTDGHIAGVPPQLPGYRSGLAPGTETTTAYDSKPPSPPPVEVLMMPVRAADCAMPDLELEPKYEGAQGLGLTEDEMRIITGGRPQLLNEQDKTWMYEDRQSAHPILDYLWAGPSSIVRKHDFLKEKGITMILVVNQMRTPGQKLRSVENAAAALGLEVQYVDPQPLWQQVATFNETLQLINKHVLDLEQQGKAYPDSERTHAKVLVICETGNEKSAMVVASYIMAMYSQDLHGAIRYTISRRLSFFFDDNMRRALQTWGDILKARNSVARKACRDGTIAEKRPARMAKRGFTEIMDMEVGGGEDLDSIAYQKLQMADRERFANRQNFTPFRDVE